MKKIDTQKGFDIYFAAEKCDMNMRTHFIDECGWSKKEYASLTKTKPKWFVAHVVVKKAGIELGEAYLGGCCYSSVEEFYTKYKSDYFADMVNEAMAEAQNRLPDVIKSLKSQANAALTTVKALESDQTAHSK